MKNSVEVSQILKIELGLSGGSVVKNLPANAEDMGLTPELRRFHTSWSSWACVPQLLCLCSRAREPRLPKPERPEPVLHNKRDCCREAHTPQLESSPIHYNQRKACTAKNKYIKFINLYMIIYEIDLQSRFDAWERVLRAGALWWPRGKGWGGRWQGGSGWGTHV